MQWRTVHGEQIPTIGLGTYELDGGECAENTVRDALEIGYRHIDTAEHYDNQSKSETRSQTRPLTGKNSS